MAWNTELLEGDRFDEAVSAAIEAHRNEVHQLRKALAVLTFVPEYQAEIHRKRELAGEEVDGEFEFKQNECTRIAKLYADETLLDGIGIDDVISILQEGLVKYGSDGRILAGYTGGSDA